MDKTELLKVLDMSEANQIEWLIMNTLFYKYSQEESLADLAFRLRDEVSRKGFDFQKLLNKVRIDSDSGYEGAVNSIFWICHIAKPIHWIIAALIAKGE